MFQVKKHIPWGGRASAEQSMLQDFWRLQDPLMEVMLSEPLNLVNASCVPRKRMGHCFEVL